MARAGQAVSQRQLNQVAAHQKPRLSMPLLQSMQKHGYHYGKLKQRLRMAMLNTRLASHAESPIVL